MCPHTAANAPLSQRGMCRTQSSAMQSGKIKDAQITAPSIYTRDSLPQFIRLNKHLGDCAWSAAPSSQVGSWLQVYFGHTTQVTCSSRLLKEVV